MYIYVYSFRIFFIVICTLIFGNEFLGHAFCENNFNPQIAAQVIQKLEALKTTPLGIAGASLPIELQSVIELVSELSAGRGPKAKDILKYSLFFVLVLKRCENFHQVACLELAKKGALFGTSVTLVGAAAVRHSYALALRVMNDKGSGGLN